MEDPVVDFLRVKRDHPLRPVIDWQRGKDTRVQTVEGLYAFVREMLRDSIASQDVTVRTFDTQVTEDLVGTYSIPVLGD